MSDLALLATADTVVALGVFAGFAVGYVLGFVDGAVSGWLTRRARAAWLWFKTRKAAERQRLDRYLGRSMIWANVVMVSSVGGLLVATGAGSHTSLKSAPAWIPLTIALIAAGGILWLGGTLALRFALYLRRNAP